MTYKIIKEQETSIYTNQIEALKIVSELNKHKQDKSIRYSIRNEK